MTRTKGSLIGFWIATALFCLQMGFTAYAELSLPQVAAAFKHLGYPDYFRVELSWAKLLGIVVLLVPLPARLKEWAYAGFANDLASAIIAHLAVGDGPGELGLGGRYRRALGLLLCLLATPAGRAGGWRSRLIQGRPGPMRSPCWPHAPPAAHPASTSSAKSVRTAAASPFLMSKRWRI